MRRRLAPVALSLGLLARTTAAQEPPPPSVAPAVDLPPAAAARLEAPPPETPPPASPAPEAPPPASPAPVMRCLASADCGPTRRCLRRACVDTSTFRAGRQVSEAEPVGQRPEPTDHDEPHFYLGGSLGLGPAYLLASGALIAQGGLRLGGLMGLLDLQADLSPGTTAVLGPDEPLAMVRGGATVGARIPLSPDVAWVLRVGAGGGVVVGHPRAGAVGFGEGRLDLIGVAIRTSDDVVVELAAPSVRITAEDNLGVGALFLFSVDRLF